MEKYFDDPSTITEEEVLRALRNATVQMAVVPMLCGSSFKNKGVQTLLDYVCAFLPSPLDTPNIIGTNPDTGLEEDRKPDDDEKTSALAFKIATDPYVGRLTFFRVYSGKLKRVLIFIIPVQGRRSAYPVCSRCTQTSRIR